MGFGTFLKGLGAAAGVAAAPFTGGASLALTAAGIGADVAGGLIENRAIGKARDAQLASLGRAEGEILSGRDRAIREVGDSRNAAIQSSMGAQNEITSRLQPWEQAGQESLFSLREMLSRDTPEFQYDPSQVQLDPSFDFVMREAMKGLSRTAAGQSRLRSGDTYKELARYATGLASREYAAADARSYRNQSARYQSMIESQNRRRAELLSLTEMGRGANREGNEAIQYSGDLVADAYQRGGENIGDIYTRSSRDVADLAMTGGDVRASGIVGRARGLTDTIDRVTEGVGQFLSIRDARRRKPVNPNPSYDPDWQGPRLPE